MENLDLIILPKRQQYLLIDDEIDKVKNNLQSIHLIKIFSCNPLEKIVPLNLWFSHSDYKILHHIENDKKMRIRYYDGRLLTPLISTMNPNLHALKSVLDDMSIYQPFYPETFYSIWEFMNLGHLKNIEQILFIGREWNLGSVESIMLYLEYTQINYLKNIYHCCIIGNEKIYYGCDVKFEQPNVDYLIQAYKLLFLNNTKQFIQYDLIFIDLHNKLSGLFDWLEEDKDLMAILFYLYKSVCHLNKNGSMIIRLNMLGGLSWTILLELCSTIFHEYSFFRPSTCNIFNSEIYLFLNCYKGEHKNNMLKFLFGSLYRQIIRKNICLNMKGDSNNPIVLKYEKNVKKWLNNIKEISLKLKNSVTIDSKMILSSWCKSNNILQIKSLNKNFLEIFTSKSINGQKIENIKIKLCPPNKLCNSTQYNILLNKKAKLNLYKRTMDTKPSQIHSERYSQTNGYFLKWEQLTNKLTMQSALKNILKNYLNVDMPTNAWIKMYEMLSNIKDIIPIKCDTVRTFHICEAPGAFISAINHYLSDKGIKKYDWYAQTLLSEKGALQDHFGLIKAYPDRWLYGPNDDYSGDITHSRVIKYYASKLSNIDFMTADAGFQCNANDLNEQELFMMKTNMGQIICILACLSVGKSAIFKTFLPLTEPLSISLMYLLSNLFERVNIVKPVSSHSYNSEIYVCLHSYKGIDSGILEMLYILLDDPKINSKSVLYEIINNQFFESYIECVDYFITRQINSLQKIYYYYYHYNEITSVNHDLDISKWFQNNPVKKLDNDKRLIN
uniref:Adrift-type SAM-dependent 2'-O-MTase domain-containing protein n=1 Tax=viral metagenome TaxID=1070528 RepID=A0A6C0LRQ0_9ZZZZ